MVYVKYITFLHIHRRMRKTKVLIATVVLCLAVLALSPSVSAESEITVAVNGEDIADGETAEVGLSPFVNVTVESDATITSVRTGTGSSYSIDGVETSTYRTARNVTVLNEEVFTVEVNEASGETYTHSVVLTRPSETPRDIQREVRSIRRGIESMEDEVDRLEERRNELRQRNENLTRRLNETRAQLDGNESEDGGDGQGLPGFTVVAALLALSLVSLTARHRRGT